MRAGGEVENHNQLLPADVEQGAPVINIKNKVDVEQAVGRVVDDVLQERVRVVQEHQEQDEQEQAGGVVKMIEVQQQQAAGTIKRQAGVLLDELEHQIEQQIQRQEQDVLLDERRTRRESGGPRVVMNLHYYPINYLILISST